MKKLKIDDLYFGISVWDNHEGYMVPRNLFSSFRIKHAVATWVLLDKKSKEGFPNPLRFCFGDTQYRCEYEVLIDGFPKTNRLRKYDIYSLYVLPNADLLMSLVNRVSVNSAREFLKREKKR